MGTEQNTAARTYLHNLLDQKMHDKKIESDIKTAISYSIASSYDTELKDKYFNLAKTYHDAVVYGQNKELLEVGDLTQLHADKISETERDLLVSINSRLAEQLGKSNILQIRKQIHDALKTCEQMRQAGLDGDHEEALDIYFEELVPQAEQIPHFNMHLPTFDELIDKHALAAQTSANLTIDQRAAELSPQAGERQNRRIEVANDMHATGNTKPQLHVHLKSEYSQEHQIFLLSKAKEVLQEKGFNTIKYEFTCGNEVQAHATEEAIEIQNKLVELLETYQECTPLLDLAMTTTDEGLTLVYEGFTQKGFDYIEFGCSAVDLFIDCSQAAVEGVYEGARDAVTDLYNHPGATVISVIGGKLYFGYQLTKLSLNALKVTYNVGKIGYSYYKKQEQGAQDWQEYTKPLELMTEQLADQLALVRTPDAIKFTVKNIVQLKIETKILEALHKVYSDALSKAEEWGKACKNYHLQIPKW